MQATGIRQGADTRRINELVTWLLEHPVSDDEVGLENEASCCSRTLKNRSLFFARIAFPFHAFSFFGEEDSLFELCPCTTIKEINNTLGNNTGHEIAKHFDKINRSKTENVIKNAAMLLLAG